MLGHFPRISPDRIELTLIVQVNDMELSKDQLIHFIRGYCFNVLGCYLIGNWCIVCFNLPENQKWNLITGVLHFASSNISFTILETWSELYLIFSSVLRSFQYWFSDRIARLTCIQHRVTLPHCVTLPHGESVYQFCRRSDKLRPWNSSSFAQVMAVPHIFFCPQT